MTKLTNKYIASKGYGRWKVTTEGDVEGKSINNLGVYDGNIIELATYLGYLSMYSLTFKLVDESVELNEIYQIGRIGLSNTHVTLDIDSGTWGMTNKQRLQFFREMLDNSELVTIKESRLYSSVIFSLTEEYKKLVTL